MGSRPHITPKAEVDSKVLILYGYWVERMRGSSSCVYYAYFDGSLCWVHVVFEMRHVSDRIISRVQDADFDLHHRIIELA